MRLGGTLCSARPLVGTDVKSTCADLRANAAFGVRMHAKTTNEARRCRHGLAVSAASVAIPGRVLVEAHLRTELRRMAGIGQNHGSPEAQGHENQYRDDATSDLHCPRIYTASGPAQTAIGASARRRADVRCPPLTFQ